MVYCVYELVHVCVGGWGVGWVSGIGSTSSSVQYSTTASWLLFYQLFQLYFLVECKLWLSSTHKIQYTFSVLKHSLSKLFELIDKANCTHNRLAGPLSLFTIWAILHIESVVLVSFFKKKPLATNFKPGPGLPVPIWIKNSKTHKLFKTLVDLGVNLNAKYLMGKQNPCWSIIFPFGNSFD